MTGKCVMFDGEARPRDEPAVARAELACIHEHLEISGACTACAVDLQMQSGGLICPDCEDGSEAHECFIAVSIRWDDGTITPVQDIEGRNLL